MPFSMTKNVPRLLKWVTCLIWLLPAATLYAQHTQGNDKARKRLKLSGMSAMYDAYAIPVSESEADSPFNIYVMQRTPLKEVLLVGSVTIPDYVYRMATRKVDDNTYDLPYKEQGFIFHDDFNFDGLKDFAVQTGNNSCYSGPSYEVFLAGGGKFTYNDALTGLATDYCGMFTVKPKEKRLAVFEKSGCCWHKYTDFTLVNNKPVQVQTVESSLGNGFPHLLTTTTTQYAGDKKLRETTGWQLTGDENFVYGFKLKGSEKKVAFYAVDDLLLYTLLKPGKASEEVELYYPVRTTFNNTTGKVAAIDQYRTGGTGILSFINEDAEYTIKDVTISGVRRLGVEVKHKGKTVFLEGDPGTIKGRFADLLVYENVETVK